MTTTSTPEVSVTDGLPADAWLIIEPPSDPDFIVAGSETAAQQALTHWSAA
jgi:hypothetical protein